MKQKMNDHKADNKKCRCSGLCKDVLYDKHRQSIKRTLIAISMALFIGIISGRPLLAAESGTTDAAQNDSAKPGLLIITHGAPWPQWNKPVLKLEQEVAEIMKNNNPFKKIKVVFMEFAEPSVADGVEELENAGCSRIIAVPLLIAPSSHSHWDIPALLGLYSDAETEKTLKEEGAAIIRSKLPITITNTIADSDVIEKILLKQVRTLSKNPDEEAVVLLAHGDSNLSPIWDKKMKNTAFYLCGRTQITYGDWVCAEMGQEYNRAAAVIRQAAENRKRVIVVGAYLSMGVEGMHNRWITQQHAMAAKESEAQNVFGDAEIVLSKEGLLPDTLVGQWIAEVARTEINRNSHLYK